MRRFCRLASPLTRLTSVRSLCSFPLLSSHSLSFIPSRLPLIRTCATSTTSSSDAKKKVRELAEQGDLQAQNMLGEWYKGGVEGCEQNPQMAVVLFRKASEMGYAPAQNNLALCYCEGYGVPEDDKQAYTLFCKAAEQGFAPAQTNMGACFRQGTGVEPDFHTSMSWFRKAAEQGHIPALNNLAGCLLTGEDGHTVIDAPEAVKWLRQAAEQGSRDAQANLGEVLAQGAPGVTAVVTEASKWFRKAAAAGDTAALWNLGMLYMMGEGVKKDPSYACKLWFKAAKEGETRAMSCLGIAYQQGEGVEQDQEKGEAWIRKSFAAVGGTESELPPEFQEAQMAVGKAIADELKSESTERKTQAVQSKSKKFQR